MAPATFLLVLFLISGVVLIGISIPFIQRRVPPNHSYGFRVRRTLEDSEVWYAVNSYSAWRILGTGVAEIVVATALYFVPKIAVGVYAALVGAVAVGGIIVGLVQSFAYLRELTKESEAAAR